MWRLTRERDGCFLFFPLSARAASFLIRTSAAVDGQVETMVPVVVPLDDRLRLQVGQRQGAFVARPTTAWTHDAARVHEAMIAPLKGERGLIGAMTIIDRLTQGARFDVDDVRLLETIANQAALSQLRPASGVCPAP